MKSAQTTTRWKRKGLFIHELSRPSTQENWQKHYRVERERKLPWDGHSFAKGKTKRRSFHSRT